MELQPGTTLGSYEIVGPLGAGAMGAVYRARDPRLGRSVAIKIVSERALLAPRALERFEQEARAASAIDHPNIVTVHEIGLVDGTPFIVMELIEGKSLRELLSGSRLPLKTLLSISVQIADGLAAAHARGIVHRDVKPENIMVTPGGVVKILDFGIARTTIPSGTPGDSTLTSPLRMTEPGSIVGTASYMSPEQARGSDVDFRTDQFSFGSVLYEMATGRVAFKRDTIPETLVAIVREEPLPVRDVSPASPAPLRWIIERCLAKERDGRYESTQDLARELHSLKDHASEIGGAAAFVADASPPARWLRRRPGLATAAAIVTGLAVICLVAFLYGRSTVTPAMPTFKRLTFRTGFVSGARFAPDGQTIVYSASWDGGPSRLYTMIPGSKESRDLGIEGTLNAVSPQGDLLLVRSNFPALGVSGTLYRASLSGAAPRSLAENVRAASWSPDGTEIAALRVVQKDRKSFHRLEYPLGKTIYESDKRLYGLPAVFPDGNRVPFIEPIEHGFDILTVDRMGLRRKIASSDTEPSFITFGSRRGRMWITRFTSVGTEALEVTSRGRIRSWFNFPLTLCIDDVAPDGRLLALAGTEGSRMVVLGKKDPSPRDISWFDSSRVVDLSRDGTTVLFRELLSRDGTSLRFGIFLRKTDGTPALLLGDGIAYSLSPDDQWVLARSSVLKPDLVLYPTGPGEKRAVETPGFEWLSGVFLPDGKSLLVFGGESGKPKRYFAVALAGGAPVPIGNDADAVQQALISPDGRTIVLRGSDGRWWSVPSGGGEPLRFSMPELKPNESIIRFREDARAVFVKRVEPGAVIVEAIALDSGKRSLVGRLLVRHPMISVRTFQPQITPDGSTIVASLPTDTQDLYLVEGLR
ncbi:MAG TPA: protein kinase [Polyangiaceae bacterium]